jgi:hypothetical protein
MARCRCVTGVQLTNLQIVHQLLDWWRLASTPAGARAWLADDFVFDSGLEVLDAEQFVWRHEHTAPWSNMKILSMVDSHDATMVMFEGTDSVTGLRHRIAWFVHFRGGQVHKFLHVGANIPPEESEEEAARPRS